MFGSLPTTGIRGKAARHKQPRNQLTERNCAQKGYGYRLRKYTNVQTVKMMSIGYTTILENIFNIFTFP